MLIRGDDSFSFEEELCDRLDWTIDEEEDEDDLEYDISTEESIGTVLFDSPPDMK